MALATRCPHCNALFRVAADQLKLRGGLVRCGDCGQVFDGLATLSYVDDCVLSAPAASPAAVGAVIAAIRKAEAVAAPALSPHDEEPAAGDLAPATATLVAAEKARGAGEAVAADPAPAEAMPRATQDAATAEGIAEPATPAVAERLHRPDGAAEDAGIAASDDVTLLPEEGHETTARSAAVAPPAVSGSAAQAAERPAHSLATAPVAERSAAPQASAAAGQTRALAEAAGPDAAAAVEAGMQPAAAAPSPADAPAAAFLQEQAARQSRLPRPLLIAAAAVLALLLLAQLAVAFRAEILVRFPQSRPALEQLCRVFRCTVDWPMRRDQLAVVGTELQALPGTGSYELTAVVRNRGQITVALPAIELTLTDTLNRIVARRVFTATDYLGADSEAQARRQAGVAPGADLTIRIAFEAREVNAAGFVVYPFYL